MHSYLIKSDCHYYCESLNPCFNGRCTRTVNEELDKYMRELVLILVLMEDALVRNNEEINNYELEES